MSHWLPTAAVELVARPDGTMILVDAGAYPSIDRVAAEMRALGLSVEVQRIDASRRPAAFHTVGDAACFDSRR